MKPHQIVALLSFTGIETSDNVPIIGTIKLISWTDCVLRAGECIFPSTGSTKLGMLLEKYEIRIVDVIRRTGCHEHDTYLCEVKMAKWLPNTGMKLFVPAKKAQEILQEWLEVVDTMETVGHYPYSYEQQTGSSLQRVQAGPKLGLVQ